MPAPQATDHDSRRGGLAWSHELDLARLLAAIGAAPRGDPGDEAAAAEEAAAMTAAADAGVPVRDVTGVVADQLPPGPALAAVVSGADPAGLGEWDLPGVAAAYRRLAAWAQAGELSAVAEIASRTAARDDHVRVDADGRPGQVTPAAGSTVGLELVLSHPTAMGWTSLGVTLRWRLPATRAALSAGAIDLSRARLIAEATAPLDEDTARTVESAVLPRAGELTSGQLRVAVRRAVIAADPDGAEQRRRDAQRHAKVSLYPDPDGTATLAGTGLPAVHAAAAMARLTAIARAMKSAGQRGGLDYLRAIALIGLLLGTLPLIPPPAGDPGPEGPTDPDPGPPPDPGEPAGPDPGPEPGPEPGDPGLGGPDTGPGDPGPGNPGRGPGPGDLDPAGPGSGGRTDPAPGGPSPSRPGGPADDDEGGPDHRGPGPRPDGPVPPDPGPPDAAPPDPAPPDAAPPDPAPPDAAPPDTAPPDPGPPDDPGDAGYSDDYEYDEDEDDGPFGADPPAAWPPLPATTAQTPPFLGHPQPRPPPPGHPPPGQPPPGHPPPGQPPPGHPPPGHPPPGGHPSARGQPGRPPPAGRPPPRGQPARPPPWLLDLVISWRALDGDPAGPATLSRIGPITGAQARLLALTAATDPHARWQVILTDPDGYATAVETIRRHHPGRTARPAGVTGQVTVTIAATTLDQLTDTRPDDPAPASTSSGSTSASSGGSSGSGTSASSGGSTGTGIRAAVLRAARRARAHAQRQAAADAAAPGGCAHTTATAAYRPTARIRDYVVARDQTCRDPRCRQPARHADLDHTVPYDQGGKTCGCNIGPRCRVHHLLKQLPGWTLTQPRPGHFQLTTPAGRTYTTTPDPYPT